MTKRYHEQKMFEIEHPVVPNGPVECLGMIFEDDGKRQVYFLEKLREKLKDPDFRKIDGFPLGEDEDILALSDPPYYTACPNPFIKDYISQFSKPYNQNIPYNREPFAVDVSEGKNDPIYNAHSYHTKVPHKAIMRYILHYTDPGDVVYDGFCGTGMTGVAARLCGDKTTIESLGYVVREDGVVQQQHTDGQGQSTITPISKIGQRRAILNDLSPAATFIAHNYNNSIDIWEFEKEAKCVLEEIEEECGWMYETVHDTTEIKGRINYTLWSDVFVCSECAGELVFWEEAVDKNEGKVRKSFFCPHCAAKLTKRIIDRAFVTKYDKDIGQTIRQAKQKPVLINYSVGKKRYQKIPDSFDLATLEKIEKIDNQHWFPTEPILYKGERWGDTWRAGVHAGITNVHHFYTKRNLVTLAAFLNGCSSSLCKWLVTGVMQRASKQHQIAISRIGGPKEGEGGATAGHRRGTLYIPSNQVEFNPFLLILKRLKMTTKALKNSKSKEMGLVIETASSTKNRIDDNSIDYIFIDPPFGGNILYSELNFLWEATLKVKTNPNHEAITSRSQQKSLIDYQVLMYQCFCEYYRILKPGHWMTVEFHNSQSSVWISIQEALLRAGFVIADVRVLDKKIKTHTQRIARGSVNKDLAITAYKPNDGLEERFKIEAGTEDGVWDFIRTHLKQLPVFVSHNGKSEIIAERQNFLLFDRMVAFHVQRNVTVPLSATEFYAGLDKRFPPRDGMYFLPEQAAEYDKKRMAVKEVLQLKLFVSDEASAIEWLKQKLTKKPQTFQEIHTDFMRELHQAKHEKMPDLRDEILAQNFLRYDGEGDVPSQIHSYLSSNFKDLRNLEKDNSALKTKAKDRWYVPDPKKAGDLEKLRERALIREFEEYRESKQKRLKVFRLEAVRVGFKKAWQERDYETIIAVANKIPDKILQEDSKLIMWFDQAITRIG